MKLLAQFDINKIQVPTGARTPGLIDINNPDLKIGDIIGAVLPYIFGAAGIALLIYMIFGGFQLMLSRGDPKAMQGAQGKITNALIGFVIIIVAFLIVQLLATLFGSTGTGGFGLPFGAK